MTIHLDQSATSVVVWCTRCPSWRALRNSKASADAAASDHEAAVHPGTTQARDLARISAARRGSADVRRRSEH